ncbi:hypothetical protein [Hyphomicrobium sp. LHD-15]|uniref:hypothetical protein n=1 Tax=Hyphomicrobium sp. LHD-15 TaxID=3072142 RepID=UPI00280E853D|nr:hypothetical protein [Hyphomicrobium sp. LHD-15]MDQ8697879.1 hypothetical protein [Hyphomicrobium sp. LHD-15]
MRFVLLLALCLVGFSTALSPARAADPIVSPERGSPLRAAVLDAARPLFEQETGGPVEFVINTLNVMGEWAYGDVQLQRPGGSPIDWRKTKFAADFTQGMLETGHNLFLLQQTGGKWIVVEYAVGPTDIAWDWWRQQRNLPAELFGASSADFPPPARGAQPRSGN